MAPDWSLSLVHTTDHYSDKQDDTDHSPHHSTDIEGRRSDGTAVAIVIGATARVITVQLLHTSPALVDIRALLSGIAPSNDDQSQCYPRMIGHSDMPNFAVPIIYLLHVTKNGLPKIYERFLNLHALVFQVSGL